MSISSRGDYVIRGGRLLSVLSRWRDLQKPNSIRVLSAFFEGEAQIVGGVLELARSKVREETGRLSPSQRASPRLD